MRRLEARVNPEFLQSQIEIGTSVYGNLKQVAQELARMRKIVTGGTSAHRQLAIYNRAIKNGADKKQALEKVVDLLIEETVAGL